MPSTKKVLHFLGATLAQVVAVAILGYGMSAQWVLSVMECSPRDTDFFNGTAEISLGLFSGLLSRKECPNFGGSTNIEVLDKLKNLQGASFSLHIMVLVLLICTLITAALSILITLYNSVSNPYQTYLGPLGLYAVSGSSTIFCFLALILFLANVFATGIMEKIVLNNVSVELGGTVVKLQVGFYLLIPCMVLSLLAILVIYLYQHAAYTRQREQQKPTEDAPKEIMMY